jgi:hypothetical protein
VNIPGAFAIGSRTRRQTAGAVEGSISITTSSRFQASRNSGPVHRVECIVESRAIDASNGDVDAALEWRIRRIK